jgi:DNA-binding SARP family transcriptional activator
MRRRQIRGGKRLLRGVVEFLYPSPDAEHLYRELMIIFGKLGRASDIQRVYRELEAALSEGLETEPTDETSTLKANLIRDLTQGAEP